MTKGRAAYLGVLLMLALAFALSAVDAAILTAGAAALEPHGPYASTNNSCAVCHDVHGSTVGRKLLGPDGGTAATETDVCFACHGTGGSSGWDVETAGVQNSFGLTPSSGHSVEEAAADPDLTNYCSSCHGPHGDPNDGEDDLPKLEINGFTVDRATNPNSWCEACHDPDRPATENWSGETGDAYYDQIFTSRDADTYITFGTFRGWDAYNNTSAHSSISPDSFVNPVNASDTVIRAEGDCLWCHSSHRSENIYDNLVGEFGPTSWAVCDDCHLTLNPAGDWGTGHIVSDAASPLDGLPLPCYECHNAHGSKNGNTMLAQDSLGQLLNPDSTSTTYTVETQAQFCYTCHLSSDGYGWNSYSSPPAMELWDDGAGGGLQSVPGITTSVAGIARADMVLPPSISQHESGTLVGCSCHGSVHAPGPGVSSGGQPCYDCHMALEDDMEYSSTSPADYGHIVGKAGRSGETTSYPDYTTDSKSYVYCLSCHMDHTFNSDQGLNLRTSVDGAATAARTDHAVGTASGLCVSCHSVAVGSVTYTVAGSDYQDSAHDYIVDDASLVGYGVSPDPTSAFNPNCTKCHTDPVGLDGRQDGTYKIAPHFSDDESRLAKALGATLTGTTSTEENLCFACHNDDTPLSDLDGYGVETMSGPAQDIEYYFTTTDAGYSTYRHDVVEHTGVHVTDENQDYISANKHVECEDCHNPHVLGDNALNSQNHGVGTNLIDQDTSPIAGVSGVRATYEWGEWTTPSYAEGTATKEHEICFKCHSSANTGLADTNSDWYDPQWTNVALEFNPTNDSYHPVFAALPTVDAGPNSGSSQLPDDNRLGGNWTAGRGQTMYCSDCHGDSAASPLAQGPHGSSAAYILKGPNSTWPGSYSLGGTVTGLFCLNCHPNLNSTTLSNGVHTRGAHRNISDGVCTNCHITIPHGGKVSRLIVDADSSAIPARYVGTGASIRSFRKDTSGSYNKPRRWCYAYCQHTAARNYEDWDD